jgi:hypothetical protein
MLSQLAGELVQSLDEEIDTLKNPRGRSRGGNNDFLKKERACNISQRVIL